MWPSLVSCAWTAGFQKGAPGLEPNDEEKRQAFKYARVLV